MIQIFKKLMHNQVVVFSLIIAFALVAGASIIGFADRVNAVEQDGSQLGCYFGGQNGAFCGDDGDCTSGNCVGGDGSCFSGSLGTCQPQPPACTDEGLQCGSNAECTAITGPNSTCNFGEDPFSGCQISQCVAEICTSEVPQAPTSFEASFVDSNTLSITVPAAPQNGGGDSHHIKVVLATQDIDAVQAQFALVDQQEIPLSTGQVVFMYSISWPSPQGPQPVKVGIQNYDDCQDIFGAWKIVSPVVPPPDPASVPSCTGTIPPDSALCSGDDVGITTNTPWTTVASCSSPAGSAPKCQRTCINGTVPQGNLCVYPGETGNVFGWAWSSNIGWIKMNSCEDENPFDGAIDSGSCSGPAFGVRVNNNGTPGGFGTMDGHAWSPNIGWVKFGGLSGYPTPSEIPGTVNLSAHLVNDTPASTVARKFRGWAQAISAGFWADATPGYTGWISLSDNTPAGSYTKYPSGAPYIDGNGGMTYHIPSARIVGYAWGGDVLGWIKFSGDNFQTTYGAPGAFDYSLSASPSSLVLQTGDSEPVSIERNLLGGESELVTITDVDVTLPGGIPSTGLNVSISGANNPCDPDCSSNIIITANAQNSYIVIVTGESESGIVRTVNIPVTVDAPGGPLPVVTCVVEGSSPFLINEPVTWRATASGGEPGTYTFVWSGSDGLSCLANQSCQTVSGVAGEISEVQKIYATTGNKEVRVSVNLSPEVTCVNDPGGGSTEGANEYITVIVQPDIIEF